MFVRRSKTIKAAQNGLLFYCFKVSCVRNFLHVSFFPIFARFVFQIEYISFCRIKLSVSPYSIYMRWNSKSETYFLQNKVEGSGTGPYMGIFKDKDGVYGVFMDRKENCAIRFEKAKDYSETNKVYLVKINTLPPIKQLGYLTVYPNDENKLCDYKTSLATEGSQEYENQKWKVITKNEYYLLFHTNPAYMKSPVDASFLITCPDFRIHDAGAAKWIIKSEDQSANVNSHVRFGDETMYKTRDKVSGTTDEGFTGRTEDHQKKIRQVFLLLHQRLARLHILSGREGTQGRMVPAAMQRIQHIEQFGEHHYERQTAC